MHLELNGRRVSFRRAGRGTPILLIPPFPLSRLMWEEPMAALGREHIVAAIDLPGFGGSAPLPEEETTIAAYADAAEAVAKDVAPDEPWILCGMSMGGYVIFEMLRRASVNVRGLILADTRAMTDTPEQRAGRLELIERTRLGGAAAATDALLPKMLTPACDPERRRHTERWMRSASKEGLLGALHALLTRPDSVPTLATIDVPALCIVGEHDPISPPAEMAEIAKGIRRGELVTLAGASHFSSLEKPDEFLAAVQAWLAKL